MNADSSFARSSSPLWSALIAVLCIGGVMAYSILQETPVGRVEGAVLLSESGQPLAHAKVTLTSDEKAATGEVRRLRAETDAQGRFELARVAVGPYRIAATTRAHATDERVIFVSEEETTDVPLQLKRSRPDLKLAQGQKDFLPSETVVVPVQGYVDGQGASTLRVRIFKTRLADVLRDPKAAKALSEIGNRYELVAQLPAALLHPAETVAPRLISQREMPVRGADIEGFFHERVKLGTLAAGLYLVDVAHGSHSVCAQMMVSDTALIVKKSRGELLAYTVESGSGKPRAGASIRVFQDGKTLARARSDAQGLARIPLSRRSGGEGRLMTLATLGNSEATVGQYDYQGEENEGQGEWTVHAYTDRPLYRPGGRVSYKGIARRTLDAGLRYAVASGETLDVEVRDPSGARISQQQLATNGFGSFHSFVELSPEAPTGTYSLVMSLRGEEHTADFTVASYRKPEFSATVSPNEKHYAHGDTVEMMVDATYYFGAPVSGGQAHYSVFRAPDWASIYAEESNDEDEYAGEFEGEYGFDAGEIVAEGDVTLDQNGHAIIRFAAQKEKNDGEPETGWDEPQDQIYSVQVSVTDAAKRAVEASGEVPVTAGDFRLKARTQGYFASPGEETTVAVEAKDFEGRAVAGKAIELSCSYRKWNSQTQKAEETFVRRYGATTGADGAATISVTPPREGQFHLSAQTFDSQKRAIIATQTIWVAGDEGGNYDAQYGDLSLLTDKKRYNSGETARVLLNSQHRGGSALVTVEGSRLFRAFLVPLTHQSTAIRVPIKSDYGPNVTLAACLVRNKKFARSEAPLRVEVPQRAVRVAVQADRAKYQPGDKVTYNVQTTNFEGEPVSAELSFGVVDEAIYALQEDDRGALRRAFYPKNPNSVETAYSFEPLYLGDTGKAEPEIEARTKFLDTAFWQPDLQTDASGKASVSFVMPDNLTTWRATAFAQTLGTAFGHETRKVVVAKDFFVRLETPRFFTGGDQTQITALVHNETGQEQTATVKMEAEGLALEGETTQSVKIASGAVGQAVWPVSTDPNGVNFSNQARLKLSSWTPQNGGKVWTDAVETSVPVRPFGRERIENFVGQIAGGKTVTQPIALDAKAIAASSEVTVRLTPSISDALVGGLRYLTGFPYGCIEQTMSRFLPNILVQRALRLHNLQDAESRKLRARLPAMVRDGVTRLGRLQHESGGWGWWEADGDDPWMTAYVLYGLSQARAEGYDVDAGMVARGREAALKMLAGEVPLLAWQRANWQNTRAFLLFCVAGAEPTAKELAVVRSERAKTALEPLDAQALGYLVLLDKKLGSSQTAWPELEARLTNEGGQMLYWRGSGRDEWADWNDKTATAVGLQALIATDAKDPRIPSVLLWLMAHRQNEHWGNTRDTAWTLAALCDYLGAGGSRATQSGALEVRLNGKTLHNVSLSPQNAHGEQLIRLPWHKLRASQNSLSLQHIGSGNPVFYAVQVRQTIGSDEPLPAVSPTIPIKISREYRRLTARASGANGWMLQSEATGNQLQQGDRVRVKLTFNVPRDLSYVLIEDAFPSGCEVTERGEAGEGNEEWNHWWSNTDVGDDRIAFFARKMSAGKHTIEYNLRAQTPGTYNALPTLLQAMYAPEVRAETAQDRVVIR
ncbi:MAG: carboxypeptidase regulatory-like domain-containing protein [Armatimonadetes bacterium]|nr:carboxypeptidase regulatory-like domain-containing protein [Armatimonadota bacterium]